MWWVILAEILKAILKTPSELLCHVIMSQSSASMYLLPVQGQAQIVRSPKFV